MSEVYSLFPVAVMKEHINRPFSIQELDVISSLRKDSLVNIGNLRSKDSQILDIEPMKDIKCFIQNSIKKYFDLIINPKTDCDIYLTQSWVNFTDKDCYHHQHFHINSYLSGVLYFDCIENDRINFNCTESKYSLDIIPEEHNEFNSTLWWLPCEPGFLYIFPSKLNHSVNINKTDKTRISLSFNTFIKGNIGSEEQSTFLNL